MPHAPAFDAPAGYDPDTIAFSVDVEWAAQPVIDDLRGLFDTYGVRATWFVTHAGCDIPGHERGLHPNFNRNGDTMKALPDADSLSDAQVWEHVVARTHAFAPEAKGVRSHSLRYDSMLLPVYARAGLQYDASYQLPLAPNLQPVWKHHDILEIPMYLGDHFDLLMQYSGFDPARLHLDRPGLKVFSVHPNLVYINAPDQAHYTASREHYHDPQALLAMRHPGRGVRTLLMSLLEAVAGRKATIRTLGEINALWRTAPPPWGLAHG